MFEFAPKETALNMLSKSCGSDWSLGRRGSVLCLDCLTCQLWISECGRPVAPTKCTLPYLILSCSIGDVLVCSCADRCPSSCLTAQLICHLAEQRETLQHFLIGRQEGSELAALLSSRHYPKRHNLCQIPQCLRKCSRGKEGHAQRQITVLSRRG